MKSKFFVIGVVVACLVLGFLIYAFIFGAQTHFVDAAKTTPKPGS